jgi:hypothetical protein
MCKKIANLLSTVKYLRWRQIFYRLYYWFKRKRKCENIHFTLIVSHQLKLQDSLFAYPLYKKDNTFSFLNQKHTFSGNIDWNYNKFGMLWAYNLNYFEFLHQPDLDKNIGLNLINDYIDQYKTTKIGFDSYPISLRNIFWLRFLSKNSIKDTRIDSFLYDEYQILLQHPEYHLLGNHLLENAFSILFGAYYFHDEKMYRKVYKLLKNELTEQILNDGAHFELSPMYHQMLLYRLLDCINLIQNNHWKNDDLLNFMSEKASKMLAWLDNITFPSGKIPLINDAAENIAPFSKEIFEYAEKLNIKKIELNLSDSNYRIFKDKNYKCIIDIGGIAPNYQPGHAHADTFNFVLEVNNRPVIVDTGCSTYEQGNIRLFERGTSAHNTVTIDNRNSSDVWASHRVGKRAKVTITEDLPNKIIAQHDGYKSLGKIHRRTFFQNENSIQIIDTIDGNPVFSKNIARFHLDSSINDITIGDCSIYLHPIKFIFEEASQIYMEDYEQAVSFNQRKKSKCICLEFVESLTTTIVFE